LCFAAVAEIRSRLMRASDVEPISPRAARLSLALLLALNLLNYIDRYVLAAVEPEIRETFFAQEATIASSAPAREQLTAAMAKTGSLATAFLLSYMVAAPIFGMLADRMSRWVLVGLAVAVWTLASGASGLAPTFSLLVLTRCFVGIGEAGYGPAAPTMISDLYPVERRGRMLAWFYMAIPVGSALGYALGGTVSQHWGWRAPFLLVVPPGLLLAGCCLLMTTPRRPVAAATPRPSATLEDYRGLLRIPSYVLATLGMAAMTFAAGGFAFWMPAYLHDAAHAGDLASVNTKFGLITVVAGIAATLLGGWLGDVLRRYTSGAYFVVSAAGMVASAFCVILMVHAADDRVVPPGSPSESSPLLWVWIGLAVFFLFLNTGPSNAILANVTRPSVRASAFALNIFIIHALGDAISPPLLGAVAGRSWNAALYVVCGMMALSGVLWFSGVGFLGRDTDRAEQSSHHSTDTCCADGP
jgi:MFS transporter, Spinster family, sphingosine-1-phosphate transporter